MAASFHTTLSEPQLHIVETICYFDIFQYPINWEEIKTYSKLNGTPTEALQEELVGLLNRGVIHELEGEYFSLQNIPTLVPRRKKGNENATGYLKKAYQVSKFIAKFPFVRGVYISGSLSKGYMAEDGDIDYFIITKPGRLWLARTLLILYKKIFLLNSRKYFCLNYFIDENHLEIEEKNRFTAMELSTLIPMVNYDLYKELWETNSWRGEYFPNAKMQSPKKVEPLKIEGLKKRLEKLTSGKLGEWLDAVSMKLTLFFWKRKFDHFDDDQFKVALKSRKFVSKHHPQNFQNRVLKGFEERVNSIKQKLVN